LTFVVELSHVYHVRIGDQSTDVATKNIVIAAIVNAMRAMRRRVPQTPLREGELLSGSRAEDSAAASLLASPGFLTVDAPWMMALHAEAKPIADGEGAAPREVVVNQAASAVSAREIPPVDKGAPAISEKLKVREKSVIPLVTVGISVRFVMRRFTST
jgi:hypothetical protein